MKHDTMLAAANKRLTMTSILNHLDKKQYHKLKKYKNRLNETGSIIQAAKWADSFNIEPF
jgi:hypothetical protein